MDNYLTFLYVRRGNAGVKSIRIHRTLAISVCAAVFGLISLSIVLVSKYSRAAMDSATVAPTSDPEAIRATHGWSSAAVQAGYTHREVARHQLELQRKVIEELLG